MEKKVQIYRSFAEAEEADAKADMELTPDQRVQIVIELWNRRHPDAAEQRFARVCRITRLERS
jgi:hypothetical protein